jgi:hypothetical protein
MSEFKIEPFAVSQTGVRLRLLVSYELFATATRVYYFISDENGTTLQSGDVYIPPEVYSEWTDTDQTLLDYVSKELGVTFVS